MGILKSTMGEHILLSESEAPALLMGSPTTPSDNERETRQKNKSALKSSEMIEGDQGIRDKVAGTVTEDKAAKIQRLKSGFRICKPQGSFLWPNPSMTFTPQLLVQVDDPFVVPTPPSVSSSTASAPRLLHISQPQIGPQPTSPVKPLAEKRPVCKATLCTVSKPSASAFTSPPLPPETCSKTSLINLNEVPPDQNDDTAPCGTLTTYQRRHHTVENFDSIKHVGILLFWFPPFPSVNKLKREITPFS